MSDDEAVNEILNKRNISPVMIGLIIVTLLSASVFAVTVLNSSNHVVVNPKPTPVPISFTLSVNDTSPFVGDGVRVTATFNQQVSGSVVFKGNGTSLGAAVTVSGNKCSFDFTATSLDVIDVSAVATLN